MLISNKNTLKAGKLVTLSVATVMLMGASVETEANIDPLLITNLTQTLEQEVTQQMQEMVEQAKNELTLSLQTQLSELMVEVNEDIASFETDSSLNEKDNVLAAVKQDQQ